MFHFTCVQEMSNTNWSSASWAEDVFSSGSTNTGFRFVNWSALANGEKFLDILGASQVYTIPIFGCQFYNGRIESYDPNLFVTNCLFQRVAFFQQDNDGNDDNFYNNLFKGGSVTTQHDSPGTWTFSDNLFDGTSISQDNPMDVAENNGFVTNYDRLLPTNTYDVVLTNSPAYEVGTLGVYYYPTDLPLIHAGSRPAPDAGLYYYTVTTNDAIEGTNTVSIGFHYLANGSNGLPPFGWTNCDFAPSGSLSIEAFVYCIGSPVFVQAIWTDIPGQVHGINVDSNGVATPFTNSVYSTILTNWNVVFWGGTCSTNEGSAFFFQPTNSGVGTNIFYFTYTNDSPCGGGPFTLSVSNAFTVVDVASLAPTNTGTWSEVASSTPNTRTFLVPVNTNAGYSSLAVDGTPTPNVAPTNLPGCWSLNGLNTNVAYVNIALPATYTIVCTCGSTSLTNFIVVTPGGGIDQGCGTNPPSQLAYWSFNQPALLDWWPGQSNALDIVGTNNGTLYGNVTYTNASYSNAFSFDGSNSYISFGTNAGNFGTNNFSVDFWMETTATNQQAVIGKRPACGAASLWDLRMTSNGTIMVEVCQDTSGTDYSDFTSQAAVNDGYFHHVTLTRWGANISLYIDSSLDTTVVATGIANIQNPANLTAGASACIAVDGTAYFTGMMSQIMLALGDINPWVGTNDHHPLQYYNLQNPATPWNGGLLVDSTNAAKLAYHYIEPDGSANLNGGNGAVQFWFSPEWNGGTGTGAPGYLFELGDVYSPGGGWALQTDPSGSVLSFVAGANGMMNTYFSVPITNWLSGAWYQLVLDYSPSATALYINGVMAGNGPGLSSVPDLATRLIDGFTVGSDPNGMGQAGGIFDELTTFNCPLSDSEVASGYPYPAISSQPQSQTIAAGSTAFFPMTAINTVSYQWQLNGANLTDCDRITGTTSNLLSVADVSDADAGSYSVTLSNAVGSLTSANALLTINDAAELGLWYFDTANWAGMQGQLPLLANNVQAVMAWSTNGLQIDSASAAQLVYRDVETNGSANICCRVGSVILWFNPNWSSVASGGTGPQAAGRFIELGSYGTTNDWWALLLSSDGNSLSFCTASNGTVTTNVTASISLTSNTWHQIALTYSAAGSAIYVDGANVNGGSGVAYWPRRSVRAQGFSVGSDSTGTNQIHGVLAELQTFNYPLDSSTISDYYDAVAVNGQGYLPYFQQPFTQSQTAIATIQGYPSAGMAILVNSTNFASATWMPFNPSPTVALGPGDGQRDVWFGFQTLDGLATWILARVTVDTVAPTIFITNPLTNVTSQPMIQLQGYSPEALSSLTFDVRNAAGILINQQGQIIDQYFDTNLWAFTTNSFQCFDIGLSLGANVITLRATDLAGNCTSNSYTYTLDFSGATNPLVTLYWPQDGTQIGGTNITVRGLLDDPTAQVFAQIVDNSGNTNSVAAVVERTGLFWAQNLPLASGTNIVTIMATDAAGKSTTTNISVVQSSVVVNIDPVSADQLNLPLVTVSGETNTGGYTVWVNGVQAANNGGTNWIATNVPVNPGGTAVIQARAIPNSDNGGNGSGGGGATTYANSGNPSAADAVDATESVPDKQPYVIVQTYTLNFGYNIVDPSTSSIFESDQDTLNYNNGGVSTEFTHSTLYAAGCSTSQTIWPATPPFAEGTSTVSNCAAGGTSTYPAAPLNPSGFPYEQLHISEAFPIPDDMLTASEHDTEQIVPKFFTGGKSIGQCIVSAAITAAQVTDFSGIFPFYNPQMPDPFPIDLTTMTVGDLGKPGKDGIVYKKEWQGTTISVAVTGPIPNFAYSVAPVPHIPVIMANTADLSITNPTFCVGQQIVFSLGFTPDLSYVNAVVNWKLPTKFVNNSWQATRISIPIAPGPPVTEHYGSTNYYIDNTLLSYITTGGISTQCWYVNGKGGTISIGTSLLFANGQSAAVAALGKFNIYRPAATIEVPADEAQHYYTLPWSNTLASGLPVCNLNLGKDDGSGDGQMNYYLHIQTQFSGFAGITQLITADYSNPMFFFNSEECDGSEFYCTPNFVPTNAANYRVSVFNDGPYSIWMSPNVIILTARDFVRFCPQGSGSIYVTLGIVNWQTMGVAQRFGSCYWIITTDITTGPDRPDNSDEFPKWVSFITVPH